MRNKIAGFITHLMYVHMRVTASPHAQPGAHTHNVMVRIGGWVVGPANECAVTENRSPDSDLFGSVPVRRKQYRTACSTNTTTDAPTQSKTRAKCWVCGCGRVPACAGGVKVLADGTYERLQGVSDLEQHQR